MDNYRYGRPTFDEWDGLWKDELNELNVERAEYERVVSELDGYCRQTVVGSAVYSKDFYLRGDFTGDRTQVVEVNNPQVFTVAFLEQLQRWLIESGHRNWRIIVPTYLTKREVIVIYPDAIRISDAYEPLSKAGIERISARMKDYRRDQVGQDC